MALENLRFFEKIVPISAQTIKKIDNTKNELISECQITYTWQIL